MSDRGLDSGWIERISLVALALAGLLALGAPAAPSGESDNRTSDRGGRAETQILPLSAFFEEPEACTPKSECCRVCKKGKACGDSCINRQLTCRKTEDGCACDEDDVCR